MALLLVLACTPTSFAQGQGNGDEGDDRWSAQEASESASCITHEVAGTLVVEVEITGERYLLELHEHSVRSANFRLIDDASAHISDGSEISVMTYRGVVTGMPDSQVICGMARGAMRLSISAPGLGRDWEIIGHSGTQMTPPLRDNLRSFSWFVAEAEAPIEPWACGTPDTPRVPPSDRSDAVGVAKCLLGAPPQYVADLAIDTDYELFAAMGGTTEGVVAYVESILERVNLIYENAVGIRYQLSTLVIRSEPDVPYTATSTGGLASQFQMTWNTEFKGIERDLAHFISGKPPTGSQAIGLSLAGAVCDETTSYSVSRPLGLSAFSKQAAVVAHELGHDWGAVHCSGVFCGLMDPTISQMPGSSDSLFLMGAATKATINATKLASPCLEIDGFVPAPVVQSVTPKGVPALGDTVVRLDGTHMASISSVEMDGVDSGPADFAIKSLTQIEVTLAPAHALGTTTLRAIGLGGCSNLVEVEREPVWPPLLVAPTSAFTIVPTKWMAASKPDAFRVLVATTNDCVTPGPPDVLCDPQLIHLLPANAAGVSRWSQKIPSAAVGLTIHGQVWADDGFGLAVSNIVAVPVLF